MPLVLSAADLDMLATAASMKAGHLSALGISCDLRFTRMAIVILQLWDSEEMAKANSSNENVMMSKMDRAFTLAIYGTAMKLRVLPSTRLTDRFNASCLGERNAHYKARANVENIYPVSYGSGAISGNSESGCTIYLDLTVGAVRSYGYGNLEMLSCGEDPNSWLYDFDTTASQSKSAARRPSVKEDGVTSTSVDSEADTSTEHEHETSNSHQGDGARSGADSKVALTRKNAVTLRTKMMEGQLFNPFELRAVDPLSGYASPTSDSGQPGDTSSSKRTRVQMDHLVSRCRVSKTTVIWDHVSVEFLCEVFAILKGDIGRTDEVNRSR